MGWSGGVPFLYYNVDAPTLVENTGKIQATMSLSKNTPTDGKINMLSFKLAKYDLNGTFMGFEALSTQLNLCGNSRDDGIDFRRFGVTIVDECTFDISTLIGDNVPESANKFYELFIEDANGDLVDVPVKIDNYVDDAGDTPNAERVVENWKFARRFFIYDTVSGIKGKGEFLNPTTNTTVLRWMHQVTLMVQLDKTNREKIYVPYLKILYHSMETDTLSKKSYTTVRFASEYT